MNPSPTDKALHVSLANHDVMAMSTALDEALEKLADLSHPSLPPTTKRGPSSTARTSPRQDESTSKLLRLIDDMSSSTCRTEAARQLVEHIASHFPSAAVRCGIGQSKLTHFFDARLGWLGPESSLRSDAAKQWNARYNPKRSSDPNSSSSQPQQQTADPQSSRQRGNAKACLQRTDQGIELHLPQANGPGRCVVWIKGKTQAQCEVAWLASSAATIATIFWSRPAHSWPTSMAKLGRRTKAVAAVALIVMAVIAIWPVHYRVACTARVDTIKQRLIATPFEASLLESHVKPGDDVKAGDVLALLDGRPLRLERESIEAEIQQASKEHDSALASGRIADAQQANLKQRQLNRRYDLLSDRLKRLEVVSPIDGVVVSGDLDRYIGSPLKLGQTLIEVAPMDAMLVEIEVPEHEIGYVQPGAQTRIKFGAIGGKSLHLPLHDLFPAAELREDRNVFIGQIKVDNSELTLRPGMRGEATAYGPLRPWIWSWVRSSVERVLWWVGY